MGTPFENFLNLEVPRRPVMLTYDITSYDGDPNVAVNGTINNAPKGTFFLEETNKILWQRLDQSDSTSWVQIISQENDDPYRLVTTESMHWYADGTSGSDSNDGLTPSTPKKTLAAVFALATPYLIKHNSTIHLSGTFVDSGVSVCTLFVENAYVIIDGGDSLTVYADNGGSPWTATDALTDDTQIGVTGAGWTTDAYRGYMVEIVSGAGGTTGEVRMIKSNTSDTLVPCQKFSADPGASPTFRIVHPATKFQPSGFGLLLLSVQGVGWIYLQRLFASGNMAWLQATGTASAYLTHIVSSASSSVYAYQARDIFYSAIAERYYDPDTYSLVSTSRAGIGSVHTAVVQFVNCLRGPSVYGSAIKYALRFYNCINLEGVIATRASAIHVEGCSQNAFYTLFYTSSTYLDNGGCLIDGAASVGLKILRSTLQLQGSTSATANINNCSSHGIEIESSNIRLTDASSVLGGSGNSGAGLYVHTGCGIVYKTASPPTVTGTVGDVSVDGTTQKSTWAAITAGTPATDLTELVSVKAVA